MLFSDSALMRSSNNSAVEREKSSETLISPVSGVLVPPPPPADRGQVILTGAERNWTSSWCSFVNKEKWELSRVSGLISSNHYRPEKKNILVHQ